MIKGMDKPNQTFKQRSLLSKYEIPIDHLSFEYIKTCKDVKELERIVRILRSGEEGFYPELQQAAEEGLRALSPNNHLLRHDQPVLSHSNMSKEEWDSVARELSTWKKEVAMKELKLVEENNNGLDETDSSLPPVRRATQRTGSTQVVDKPRVPRGVSDYAAWDKYDADTELLKMDLAQERAESRTQEQPRTQAPVDTDQDRLQQIIQQAESLSETERRVLAEQEKDRGNEYYKAKDYTTALAYYSASITICPSAKAYNNRSVCYLKLCKYSAALEDANSTLALEPDNVKALFRRGLALQHKNMFREALVDMTAVLAKEPRHVLAQHVSKELRTQILTLPKTVRVMSEDRALTYAQPSSNLGLSGAEPYEVNEWGLPKVMCCCQGLGRSQPGARARVRPVRSAWITELVDEPETSAAGATDKQPRIIELSDLPTTTPATAAATTTKLNIVEVDKPEASEDFFKPKKCVVVDKRTNKNVLTNGNVSGASATLNVTVSSINGNGDSDEDFELNCPLFSEPVEVEPAA